jgi:hypothetical protein
VVAGYSGTPLPTKLGIKSGHRVLLDGAPSAFTLSDLPADVTLHRRATMDPYEIILCFCPEKARFIRRWPVLHQLTIQAGALWIAWPKKSSGMATDLDENLIREHALGNGRVDVKVCAIDATWSGLKHVIRRSQRSEA